MRIGRCLQTRSVLRFGGEVGRERGVIITLPCPRGDGSPVKGDGGGERTGTIRFAREQNRNRRVVVVVVDGKYHRLAK